MVERLPFPARAFDGTISVTALCFSTIADQEQAVREILRVARLGGWGSFIAVAGQVH